MKILSVKNVAIVDELSDDMKKDLTFSYVNPTTNKVFSITAYKETSEGYEIPRNVVDAPVEDANWERISIYFKDKLHPYQKEICNSFLQGNKNGIICAGTGVGKTHMALYIAHKLGLKTLVVVPTIVLFKQWLSRILYLTNIKASRIIQNRCEFDQPITVAMLPTLALGTRIDKSIFYNKFGLVIYDEVHRLGSEHFHKVASMFWDKYRLGLSATVTRKDTMHRLFIAHLGNVQVSYSNIPKTPKVYVCNFLAKYEIASKLKDNMAAYSRLVTYLATHNQRNLMLSYFIFLAYKKQRHILLLSDRLIQLNNIKKQLRYIFKIPTTNIGFVTNKQKQLERPILLGTYGAAATGLDIPVLDYLIYGTPRTDIRQALGRITRAKNTTPIVLDLVDMSLSFTKGMFKVRQKYYKQLKCEVKNLIIDQEEIYDTIKKQLQSSILD